jgi:Ca2+-binding EF-hand superfamily protein
MLGRIVGLPGQSRVHQGQTREIDGDGFSKFWRLGDTWLIMGNWTVDFETFSKILNRPGGFRDPGEPEEYCRGFQVFDKDMTGFIGVGQLRYILTNLGEKMSDEEVDELLKAVDTSSGEINYTGMFDTS